MLAKGAQFNCTARFEATQNAPAYSRLVRNYKYNYNLDFVASANVAAADASTTELRSLVLAAMHHSISRGSRQRSIHSSETYKI